MKMKEESHRKVVTSSQLRQAAERGGIHHQEVAAARTTNVANLAKKCISDSEILYMQWFNLYNICQLWRYYIHVTCKWGQSKDDCTNYYEFCFCSSLYILLLLSKLMNMKQLIITITLNYRIFTLLSGLLLISTYSLISAYRVFFLPLPLSSC